MATPGFDAGLSFENSRTSDNAQTFALINAVRDEQSVVTVAQLADRQVEPSAGQANWRPLLQTGFMLASGGLSGIGERAIGSFGMAAQLNADLAGIKQPGLWKGGATGLGVVASDYLIDKGLDRINPRLTKANNGSITMAADLAVAPLVMLQAMPTRTSMAALLGRGGIAVAGHLAARIADNFYEGTSLNIGSKRPHV